MFITSPTNIDYLIDDVRIRLGDLNTPPRYSDTLVRTVLVAGVKALNRRWGNRYLVFSSGVVQNPQPTPTVAGYVYATLPEGTGLIPSGLSVNDVYRNPFFTFIDPYVLPISQEDIEPVILSAAILLQQSRYSSSSDAFQTWSDGEFSYSNLASQRAFDATIAGLLDQLNAYFRTRLASPKRESFAVWNI